MPGPHGHILVVEDDRAIREVFIQILEDEGYGAVGAANGQEAIDMLRRPQRFCLILLDLMMPVMNGWQFRLAQRQDPVLAPIPVVVISADASAQEHVRQMDVDGFLKKPVELDLLLSTIDQLCG